MAVLGATTLTGCEFIEQFLGGTDPITGEPYRCVFNSTNPSVSWTKETSLVYNNAALRVTTGDGYDTGGSAAFTTVLSSGKSIGLSIQQRTVGPTLNVTLNPSPANVTATAASLYPGGAPVTVGSSTLADLPLHTHNFNRHETIPMTPAAPQRVNATLSAARQTGDRGGSIQHAHNINANPHTHGITGTHTHTVTGSHGHTPPGPGTQENFAVLYRDVIIARKDVKP